MILDVAHPSATLPATCDVCILGAGPAGIVTALELARQRPDWSIVLLEGGGFSMPTPAELDPYVGTSTGEHPYPLAGSRLRFLGGTSNHWGGWCRPLDPEDFAARTWVPLSGWPIGADELTPWYTRAAEWCEIGSTDYADASLSPSLAASILPLAGSSLLCHKYFRFSPPTRFGRRYRDDLEQAGNVNALLHANAIGLDWAGERVKGVRVARPDSTVAKIGARHVVIALGGIETTRFLLAQDSFAPAGSGLTSPMLGRCFADHFGRTPAAAILPEKLMYSRSDHPTGAVMPVLSLRPEAQESLGTGDFCLTLVPQATPGTLLAEYASNQALGFRDGTHWRYRLQLIFEPAPNPDSRITLLDERDHFGMQRVRLDWRIRPSDYRPAIASLREVGAELGAAGLGRLRLFDEEEYAAQAPGLGLHHMGGARMAENTEGGIVDSQCRVHGIENLHVASSAVFPAFGFSNPTLTIVALATRLAAHLASDSSSPATERS